MTEQVKTITQGKLDWSLVGVEAPTDQQSENIFSDFSKLSQDLIMWTQAQDVSEQSCHTLAGLLSEVVSDLRQVLGIQELPEFAMDSVLGGSTVAATAKSEEGEKVLLAVSVLQMAAREIEAIYRGGEVNAKNLVDLVFALAHELGHVRQRERLSEKWLSQAFEVNTRKNISVEAKAKKHSHPTEANADAIAIRYLRQKQRMGEGTLWQLMDADTAEIESLASLMDSKDYLEYAFAKSLLDPSIYKQLSSEQQRWATYKVNAGTLLLDRRIAKMEERVRDLALLRA
jgi:hypothetical protein